MDRFGFEEGEMIEHNMISKSIERAQRKVEENNFGIRKRLLEYDDVMNAQREVIYTKRHHALLGERIGIDIVNMMYDAVQAMIESHSQNSDYDALKEDVFKTFAIEIPFDKTAMRSEKNERLVDMLYDAVIAAFKRKTDNMVAVANPVIKQVYENQGDRYENIMIPITDGKRMYNISCNLKEAYESESKAINKAFQKAILLYTIDEAWKEHLRDLDQLRQSVQNASYEQKDPLLIFKLESFGMFKDMIDTINRKTVAILMRGQIPVREPEQVREAAPEVRQDYSKYRTQKDQVGGSSSAASAQQAPQRPEPIKVGPKVGRNDPCPCGSGKKYKNCHGKEA